MIETKGIFQARYTDKASHFKTTRHGGRHYNVAQDHEETQIERALKELNINLIPANSPQAKGRIEVTFRFFQDRFIKEMRLADIQNYEQANRFLLEKFLPWYNTHYTHQATSVYRGLPRAINLDLIFCIKKIRRVNNDNTIRVYGQILQIPRQLIGSYNKRRPLKGYLTSALNRLNTPDQRQSRHGLDLDQQQITPGENLPTTKENA